MPIFYDSDKQAWSMRDLTQEELDQLIELGKEELVAAIGANIVHKMFNSEQFKAEAEKKMLEAMPEDAMWKA